MKKKPRLHFGTLKLLSCEDKTDFAWNKRVILASARLFKKWNPVLFEEVYFWSKFLRGHRRENDLFSNCFGPGLWILWDRRPSSAICLWVGQSLLDPSFSVLPISRPARFFCSMHPIDTNKSANSYRSRNLNKNRFSFLVEVFIENSSYPKRCNSAGLALCLVVRRLFQTVCSDLRKYSSEKITKNPKGFAWKNNLLRIVPMALTLNGMFLPRTLDFKRAFEVNLFWFFRIFWLWS